MTELTERQKKIAADAADYIQQHGLAKGALMADPDAIGNCPACALGALYWADPDVHLDPYEPFWSKGVTRVQVREGSSDDVDQVALAAERFVPRGFQDHHFPGSLVAFNDDLATTDQDIIDVLRKVAA